MILVERPECRDPAAGEELPSLGVKRVGRGVVARGRQAAGLILLDPLERRASLNTCFICSRLMPLN